MELVNKEREPDPNKVVEGLSTVFYYGLRKSEVGRMVEHLLSGRKALCGENVHWWWRNGMACPATLATCEAVPDGSVNTWTQPYFVQLDPSNMMVFSDARVLHERLMDVSRDVHIDYVDLLSVATPTEVRRAAIIANDRVQASVG